MRTKPKFYTIGHRESYDKGLVENDPLMKLGFRAGYYPDGRDYIGGIVFCVLEHAVEYLLDFNDYAIYRLDTSPSNLRYIDHQFHLIESARILPL